MKNGLLLIGVFAVSFQSQLEQSQLIVMDQAVSRYAKLVDDQSEIEKRDVDSTKKEDFSGPRYV